MGITLKRLTARLAFLTLAALCAAALTRPCVAAHAQTLKTSNAGKAGTSAASAAEAVPGRPVELVNAAADVYYVPPEFAADALLRIAQSGRVTDRRWRRELLEEAFRFAADAQQPVRRADAVIPPFSVDTPAGYASYAYDNRLDALSLRTRVIAAMLKLDARRARELSKEAQAKLSLPPLNCADYLVYDVSDFYETVAEVARGAAFTAEEVKQGERLRFVQAFVEGVNSHAQVAPVVRLILSLDLPPEELSFLGGRLLIALGNVSGDDRSFSYSMNRGEAAKELINLVSAYRKHELPTQEVLAAVRAYVADNVKGARCSDNLFKGERLLPYYVAGLNHSLFQTDPLTFDETKPREVLGTADLHEYWQTPGARQLLQAIRELRFGLAPAAKDDDDEAVPAELTAEQRQTEQWLDKLRTFLKDLEQWDRGAERSEADYFHQRQSLYHGLLELAPNGWARDMVLREWEESLAEEPPRGLSRPEWFLWAGNLLKAARASEPKSRSTILEAMTNSKNPTLALYAKLERLKLLAP
ncbi:MAG TPA: hypothetical protein VJ866_19240 [Pyrinomonadaceae bacterium]|nr:hypothetical protein [Pyrinomonadaceae bacterium]